MTPPAVLSGYSDAITQSGVPLLGRITLYGASELQIRHDVLVTLLQAEGLESYAPRPPSDVDVFRRTCTAAQQKKVPTGIGDIFVNVLVRDVSNRDAVDRLTRRIVVETVDAGGKRLDYEQTHDLVFSRASAAMSVERLIPSWKQSHADKVADQIRRTFESARGTVNGNAVRDLVRRILDDNLAVAVRDGVRFVPEINGRIVEGLQRFADRVGGCDFHSLPLIDDPRQRAMVRNAMEDETSATIDGIVQEIQGLLSSGDKVSAEKYASMANQYRRLTEKATAYEALLEDAMIGTQSRLQLFTTALTTLNRQVKAA